jgi:hypothetical protein
VKPAPTPRRREPPGDSQGRRRSVRGWTPPAHSPDTAGATSTASGSSGPALSAVCGAPGTGRRSAGPHPDRTLLISATSAHPANGAATDGAPVALDPERDQPHNEGRNGRTDRCHQVAHVDRSLRCRAPPIRQRSVLVVNDVARHVHLALFIRFPPVRCAMPHACPPPLRAGST